MHPHSLWHRTSSAPAFPTLAGDLTVDVAIVGGGLTGITAAHLLKRAGKTVAVLEAERMGSGATGDTTAHLTLALDTRYHEIALKRGRSEAALVARSQREAIERIAALVAEFNLPCQFRRTSGFLYATTAEQAAGLAAEAHAARRAGVDVELVDEVPLPFPTRGGIEFRNQAQFHPRRYLVPLARRLPDGRNFVFEHTRVTAFHDGEPCRVETDRGTVTARHVLLATHAPLDRVFLQSKVAAYRTYVVAVHVSGALPDGLFWDLEEPYHYLRRVETDDGVYLLVGGEDHRVGHEDDTVAPVERLERWVRERFRCGPTTDRWSAQVYEPIDGLPYIGRNSASANVFIATGFSGNGMTSGTLAALVLSDLVLGRANRYADLYDATRLREVPEEEPETPSKQAETRSPHPP